MKYFAVLLLAVVFAGAQGTEPKATPQDYPRHAKASRLTLAADYMVRSVSANRTSFTVDDYLVVEVALFPEFREEFLVDARKFTLRVNGSKNPILTQTPGMVAASVKYPDWQQRRQVTAQAGPIIVGPPTRTRRFPDDPTVGRPVPQPAPSDAGQPTDMEQLNPSDVIAKVALPEGPRKTSVSGYVFFAYSGKLSKIRTVELIWQPPSGDPVVLTLR